MDTVHNPGIRDRLTAQAAEQRAEQARGQAEAARLDARVVELDRATTTAEHTITELLAEQQLRETMDPLDRSTEQLLRIDAHLAQIIADRAAADRAAQEPLVEPHVYEPVISPPQIEPDGPSLGR